MQINRTPAKMQIAHTSSGPVEYTLLGDGPVALVLHGAPPDCSNGLDPAILLAAGFSVLTPLAVEGTALQAAEAIAALLDVLQIQTCAVIAISGGGPTGVALAAWYPERVNRLVLIAYETGRTGHFFDDGPDQAAASKKLISFLKGDLIYSLSGERL